MEDAIFGWVWRRQSLFSRRLLSVLSVREICCVWADQAELLLTDHFDFVGRVDLAGPVEDAAGVLPAVFRRQVLQAQGPLLLATLTYLLRRQRLAVLQPGDVRPRVPAGGALEADGAAHRPGDHPLAHLGGLGEPRPHYCITE